MLTWLLKNYGFSEDNFCLVNIIIEEVEYIDTQKGNTVPFLLQYNDKKLCVPIKSVSPNSTILLYQQKAHKKRAQPMRW